MARPRKNPIAAEAAKKVETVAEVKAVEAPVAKEEVKAEAAPAPEKKKPGRKPGSTTAKKTAAAKTTAKKPGRKPAAKKTAAEKKTPGRKAALKSDITIQYGSKSFNQEELVKIAKDVWQYDLNQKASDLTSVELYVKPEESMAYYVMNKKFTGSFYL